MSLTWKTILPHAAAIVNSYDTPITLRQLFYRLVSDGTITGCASFPDLLRQCAPATLARPGA